MNNKPRPDHRSEASGSTPEDQPAPPPETYDFAKLAHELKTPLSAIVAAAEIMRDERLGAIGHDRYREYAADIHDSARHALAVINRMLQGQVSFERAELEFAEIDLNAQAERAVSALRPLADEAGLTLQLSLGDRLPLVIADAVSVRQMLLNLLTNALKFTGAGGRIAVATRYEVDGPVALFVADDGPGMSRAEIDRALSAGDGAIPQTTPIPAAGLGIGLPLVRVLAAANGATLAIESEAGRGTRVTITFARDRVVPV